MLRKVCSLCLQLLLCVWGVLKRLLLRQSGEWKGHADPASVAASQGAAPQSEWVNEEWGESWEVKVVPNEEGESSSHSNQHSNRSHDNNDGVQSSDLFRDMTPVIKKATTIQLKPALDQQQHKGSSSHRFSVESAFPSVDDGELGVLCEDGEGWEGVLEEEEGDLMQQTRRLQQEKRRSERERRMAAQELLKAQRLAATAHGLGTRLA